MTANGPLIDCEVTNFIRGYNPVWYMVDLVGKQFDDTFYMFVLTNQVPYIPANVYHDPSGTIPWSQPIQFLANGTLPLDIYFANNTIYRLEIRQGPTQADPLIYLIENYNPSQAIDNPLGNESEATDNQISNGQFSVVNFTSPQTFTNLTGSVEIAPGWFLDLSGLGSVTVTQVPLNDSQPSPTNAPWALMLTITGPYANVPVLRQRFQQNGMNWSGTNLATSYTALIVGAPQTISDRLVASNGATLALFNTHTLTNDFVEYQGVATIAASTNANVPPNAWLDYKIMLPSSGDIYITSIQLVQSGNLQAVPYQQDTIDRQLDHLSHYYVPKLEYKPISSYLVGWDFPKNPAQPLGYVLPNTDFDAGANTSYFTWDQTILFLSENEGAGITQGGSGEYVVTASANTQFALVQYLKADEAVEILSGNVAVNIAGYTNQGGGIAGTVSLWVSDATVLPSIGGANASIVATLDANGYPITRNQGTAVIGWTEITRNNLGPGSFNLGIARTNAPSKYNDVGISHYGLNNAGAITSNTATVFAIVVGFSQLNMGNSVTIQSISTVPGDIPTRPAPKPLSQVTQDCQAYFVMSFSPGTVPAQAIGANTGYPIWQLLGLTLPANQYIQFPVIMTGTPTLTLYSPITATANIYNFTNTGNCATSTTINITQTGFSLSTTDNRMGSALGNLLGVHFTADARLGK